jgi:hypothetical protein
MHHATYNLIMIWRTQLGERVLEGVEAEFYLEALHSAVDDLEVSEDAEVEPDWKTGDRIFDTASFNQKVVVLHTCLAALLKPEVPAPKLTNVLEAAAYAPFAYVRDRVFEEIEAEGVEDFTEDEEAIKYGYRLLVWKPFEALIFPNWLAVDNEMDEFEPAARKQEAQFSYRSTDYDLWDQAIDELADRIFFDRDWQLSFTHPQVLDGIEKTLGDKVGIDEDYMTTRLPRVSDEEAAIALKAIQTWIRQGYLEK